MTCSASESLHDDGRGGGRHLYVDQVELVLDEKRKRSDVSAKLGVAVNDYNFGHGCAKVDLGLVADFAAFIDERLHALHAQLRRARVSISLAKTTAIDALWASL